MAARKKPTTKRTARRTATKSEKPEFNFEQEIVVLGHLMKYNLYLLSKSVIFNSLLTTQDITPEEAADKTNRIINELDLDTKQRLEQQ